MATSPEEVLRSLSPPPKNLVGKDGQKVNLLVTTWISDCDGKCNVAELTQEETNGVFWGWLKKGKYQDLVMAHMVKKLIRRPRPKRTQEMNQEAHARKVLNAASKLHGKIAVITGGKIVEKGTEAGDTKVSLHETWREAGLKPRSVINEMSDDIQRQLLVENRSKEDDQPVADAAE
jgi:hypothetical protein